MAMSHPRIASGGAVGARGGSGKRDQVDGRYVPPKYTGPGRFGLGLFIAAVAGAAYYIWRSLAGDVADSGQILSTSAYVALATALVLALGFEFVNGFHDTANAVATVIYT